jgi:sulfide:quinone oxidoreductase
MLESQNHATPHVVIAGGGIGGIETMLALRDLAGERVRMTLVSAEPEFTYLPQLVEEPFTMRPALRRELEGATREIGADFVLGRVEAVEPDSKRLVLHRGSSIDYTDLVISLGAKRVPAYEGIPMLHGPQLGVHIDSLLKECAEDALGTLALIVPPGIAWAVPLYEFALMARRRAEELGLDVRMRVYTPGTAPLGVFGVNGSAALAARLRARGIETFTQARVRQAEDGSLLLPDSEPIAYSRALALPAIVGPALTGLPSDRRGFIPTDSFGLVPGLDGVYAVGDGTTFPIKQGGISCEQADAAAGHIAMRHGAPFQAHPFRPVLRGKLLTGADSMFMRHEVGGGAGEGAASSDPLWQPPLKVGGRYLAAWLQNEREPEPVDLDVGVSGSSGRPHEWHAQPMALEPPGQGSG